MHLREVTHEVHSRHVWGQQVVFGAVTNPGTDLRPPFGGVDPTHLDPARVGAREAEEDADEGGLARSVGAEQPGDATRDVDVHACERDDVAVSLDESPRSNDGLDGWHAPER